MQKKLIILLAVIIAFTLAACGGGTDTAQEPSDANQWAMFGATSTITPALLGEWYWPVRDTIYYVFEDNGQGFRSTGPIRWATNNGILFICLHPDTCDDSCYSPWEWHYVINGNYLELTATDSDYMADFYPRYRIYRKR